MTFTFVQVVDKMALILNEIGGEDDSVLLETALVDAEGSASGTGAPKRAANGNHTNEEKSKRSRVERRS